MALLKRPTRWSIQRHLLEEGGNGSHLILGWSWRRWEGLGKTGQGELCREWTQRARVGNERWVQRRNSQKEAEGWQVFRNDKPCCVATMVSCWMGDVTGVGKFWSLGYLAHHRWGKVMSAAEIIKEHRSLAVGQRWKHNSGEKCYHRWCSCDNGRFLWRDCTGTPFTATHKEQLISLSTLPLSSPPKDLVV